MANVDTREKKDVVETTGKPVGEATITRNTPKNAEVVPVAATPVALQPVMRFDERMLQVIKDTVGKDLDNAELRLFIATCERTGLDPIAKQIYAVKRYDRRLDRQVMTIQTGIDGFRLIAQRSDKFKGELGPWWCGEDEEWFEVWNTKKRGMPMAAKIGVLRSDFAEPLFAVAVFDEYAQRTKDGRLSGLWGSMPGNQIAKCAEALALRRGFPNELSGLYTTEEMQQADNAARAGSGDGVSRPMGAAIEGALAKAADQAGVAYGGEATRPVSRQDVVDSTRAAAEAKGAEGPLPEAEKEGRPRDANRTGYADQAMETSRRQEAEKPVPFTEEEHNLVRARIAELQAEKHPVLHGGFKKYMNEHNLTYTGVRGTQVLWADRRHLPELFDILGIKVPEPPTAGEAPAAFDPDEAPA